MSNKYNRVLANSRVLVLGGSSGIGFCVAEHTLSLGAIITISSSRQSKLDDALQRLGASMPDSAANVTGLAVDLAPIRVNCISPGAVHTEMFDNIPGDRLPAVLSKFRERSLTDSVGTPEELSEAYVYLMRCSFATGSLVEVNGGSLLA
ncbi:hypothetical protein KCU83_g8849, partial [Aureobasidium melanogenum]